MTTSSSPKSLDEVRQAVLDTSEIRVAGRGSKPALSAGHNLSLRELSGILEYTPSEYTFTAKAGTPLAEIREMLAQHHQFMPFDPPLVDAGASLGGTVASGLSGSGRYRFGGLRDFFLGVRMVTGEGRIVFGGGKVVKNAAGFDFPKLLVGSLGRLAVMVELTFKVFPAPAGYRTLQIESNDLTAALDTMSRLSMAPVELYCLDLQPPSTLFVRVGGLLDALADRMARVAATAGGKVETLSDEEDQQHWTASREFGWLSNGQQLVRMPITPQDIPPLEDRLGDAAGVARQYAVGGNVAWLGWPSNRDISELADLCRALNRPALMLQGQTSHPVIGPSGEQPLLDRIRSIFDPDRKLSQAMSVPAQDSRSG